jgi:hypothetical protein
MNQDEKSRSLGEQPTHSSETQRQLCGRAAMSVQYRLSESRNTDPRPTAGQSPSLNLEPPDRLTQIARCADELARCVAERENAHTLGDKWGVWLGEMDWYTELHRLLYEEE